MSLTHGKIKYLSIGSLLSIVLVVGFIYQSQASAGTGGPAVSISPSSGTLTGSIGQGQDRAVSSGSFVSFQTTFTSLYKQWSNGPDPTGVPSWFPIGIYMDGYGGSAPGVPGANSNTDAFSLAGINWNEGGYSYNDTTYAGPDYQNRDPNMPAAIADNANLTDPSNPVWAASDVFGSGTAWQLPPYKQLPLRASNPALNNVVKGNFVTWYDEADMNEVNQPAGSYLSAPQVSQAYADIKAADPTRPLQAGYGNCFNSPYQLTGACGAQQYAGNGWTMVQALKAYCASPDIVTADYYANASGDGPGNNWAYGRVVDTIYNNCGMTNKIVGADVETGNCCGYNVVPSPRNVQAAIWDTIMHGAHFLNYFTYFGVDSLVSSDAAQQANYQQVKESDADIKYFAPWLNAPTISGVTTSTSGDTPGTSDLTCGTGSVGKPIPVETMLKQYNGKTYLFAMTDGHGQADTYPNNQPTIPYSGCTTVTFTLPTAYSGTVAARSSQITTASVGSPDSGTISISNNQFSDNFLPYQLHVYEIN